MAITTHEEVEQGIKANEKLIALNILLVIYLHDKRYGEAMGDIEELLNDPKMGIYREYLFSKQDQVWQVITSRLDRRKRGFLQFIFDFFYNPA